MSAPDGYVVVDKPAGLTSHDVVARARRLLGERRIGHAGTLDPDATGVLVLGIGRATRLLRYVGELEKTYVGEIVLGTETTTLDASGEVVATYDMANVTPGDVVAAASGFLGKIRQVPPMVSAVKVGGRRLHELARAGQEVERPDREVEIFAFAIEPTDEPNAYRARVRCSSGTYVRTLAADLGRALGGGAHLGALRREAIGPFSVQGAVALEAIAPALVRPPAGLVGHLHRLQVPAGLLVTVQHGAPLDAAALDAEGPGPFALLAGGVLLGVYERRGEQLKASVVLAEQGAPDRAGERAASATGHVAPAPRPRSVVTIGNFDGVHLGHRALLVSARAHADAMGARLRVVTFDRHPLATLRPAETPRLLTGAAHKAELLEEAGADEVVMLTFDRARADQEAEDFVEEVLVDRLNAAVVVVGENFRFGHQALGDVALLSRLGSKWDFRTEGMVLQGEEGIVISSSRIRALIAAGSLELAAELLGRPHELRGEHVEDGALVVPDDLVVPPPGRYHAEIFEPSGEWRPLEVSCTAMAPVRMVLRDAPVPMGSTSWRVRLLQQAR